MAVVIRDGGGGEEYCGGEMIDDDRNWNSEGGTVVSGRRET